MENDPESIDPELFERLVNTYLSNLMLHQGFALRAPELPRKTIDALGLTDIAHQRIRLKIMHSTRNLLQMMGVEYGSNDIGVTITVMEIPDV